MVTYDLNKVKDYKRLYAAIEQLGTTKRDAGLDSVWFIHTNYTLSQAQTHLNSAIDKDDRFFVSQIREGEYGGWLNQEVWSWISSRK